MDANESQTEALELPDWVKLVNQLASKKEREGTKHPSDPESSS